MVASRSISVVSFCGMSQKKKGTEGAERGGSQASFIAAVFCAQYLYVV